LDCANELAIGSESALASSEHAITFTKVARTIFSLSLRTPALSQRSSRQMEAARSQ
jgi:hypothetical protein